MEREATRKICGSPENSSDIRGTGDLSQESDGMKAASRRETPGQEPVSSPGPHLVCGDNRG